MKKKQKKKRNKSTIARATHSAEPRHLIDYGYDLTQPQSKQKFERTITQLKADLEGDPNNPVIYHYLSCYYFGQGMFREALEASLKAIQLSEDNNDSNMIYLWSRYNAAMSHYRLGDLKKAEEVALSSIKRFPRHIDAHYILIAVYYDLRQWSRTIEHGNKYLNLVKLLRTSPGDFGNLVTCSLNKEWDMHVIIGIAYFELGQEVNSHELFEEAVRCAPEPFVILRAIGIYFYKTNNPAKSLLYLEKARQQNSHDETVNHMLEKILHKNDDSQKEPTISCCMIVKDEEAFLEKCLKSIRDYVDELIIVDTGSTDGTVEIAKSYGARVYHHPWENDFSKHRNQSLSYATGDWIFQLDADEELFPEDGSTLRDVVHKGNADYYHCRFYDMKKDGSVRGVFYLIRLFRNGMGMGYERKVHNQLQVRGKEAYSAIRIRHYGYDLTPEQMEAKHIRTATLLKEMLEINPEDAYNHYQLAASYSMHREFDKAVEHGEMALEIMHRKRLQNELSIVTFYTVAQGYYALGKLENAERVCLQALDSFPMDLDMCHILASIYFEKRDLERCRAMSQRYLSIYEEFERNPVLIGSSCYYSFAKRNEIFFGLACIHFLEKDFETADAFFRRAFEDSGRRMEQAEKICRLYLDQRMHEKALPWLKITYETGLSKGSDPTIFQERKNLYLKIGKDLLKQGDLKAAADCLHKAEDEGLAADEQLEKRLLQAQIYRQVEATDDFIQSLESLMRTLGMNTNRSLYSIEDMGKIVYDISEEFCRRKQWHLAEAALRLAIQIAPAMFDHGKFDRLLADAEQWNNQSS